MLSKVSSYIVINSGGGYKKDFTTGKSLPRCEEQRDDAFSGRKSEPCHCRAPCPYKSVRVRRRLSSAGCSAEDMPQRGKYLALMELPKFLPLNLFKWDLLVLADGAAAWMLLSLLAKRRCGGMLAEFNFYQLLLGGTLKFIKQAKLICSSLVSVAWIGCQVNRILHFPNYFHICVLPLFVLLQNGS